MLHKNHNLHKDLRKNVYFLGGFFVGERRLNRFPNVVKLIKKYLTLQIFTLLAYFIFIKFSYINVNSFFWACWAFSLLLNLGPFFSYFFGRRYPFVVIFTHIWPSWDIIVHCLDILAIFGCRMILYA